MPRICPLLWPLLLATTSNAKAEQIPYPFRAQGSTSPPLPPSSAMGTRPAPNAARRAATSFPRCAGQRLRPGVWPPTDKAQACELEPAN